MNNSPLRIGHSVRSDDAKIESFLYSTKRQGYSGKYREIQGYQRLSKMLNIHSRSRLFRANVRCFSIIIDCLRDSFWVHFTRKTIFSSMKVPFFFVLFIISSYLCNKYRVIQSSNGTEERA